MEEAMRVTGLHHPRSYNGQSGEMAMRPDAEAAAQRRREAQAQSIAPIPVSRSSYLYEMDRYYRAAVTVENTGDLGERAINRIVRLDRKATEAALEGVSPRAQANIERVIEVVGHTTGLVVFDYGSANQG
jgi:hypothetical protein